VKKDLVCGDRDKINDKGSACIRCEPHTRAQNNNRVCAADKCSTDKEFVNAEGKCEVCQLGYEPSVSKKDCVALTGMPKNMCDDRQIYSKER